MSTGPSKYWIWGFWAVLLVNVIYYALAVRKIYDSPGDMKIILISVGLLAVAFGLGKIGRLTGRIT
jgi:uncharacterized membrane protein (DUF2068 family)